MEKRRVESFRDRNKGGGTRRSEAGLFCRRERKQKIDGRRLHRYKETGVKGGLGGEGSGEVGGWGMGAACYLLLMAARVSEGWRAIQL